MDSGEIQDSKQSALAAFLENQAILFTGQANSVAGVKIAAKRSKHSARFADRIQKNAESVDQLIAIIKELTRQPDTADQVERLIDIAKDLLENNAKLREQVGEALQDIPD